MAWNVDSVVARPLSPASNFMVGVQRPKSRPAMVEATKPGLTPVTASEEAGAAPEPVAVPVAAAAATEAVDAAETEDEVVATAAVFAAEEALRVTVTKVVEPPVQVIAEAELTVLTAAAATVLEEATLATEDAVEPEAADPETVPAVPSAALVVKLENPWATMTSATLSPAALKGVVKEVAALAFSRVDPVTAGSMRGTTPRRASVVGRVGSLHIDGIETTKGLKFCSAPASPRAAAMT